MSFNNDLSRRGFMQRGSLGFGTLALAGLLDQEATAASGTHFAPKAKRVIFLYMDGGVSQVDSFDPKPLLKKEIAVRTPQRLGSIGIEIFRWRHIPTSPVAIHLGE